MTKVMKILLMLITPSFVIIFNYISTHNLLTNLIIARILLISIIFVNFVLIPLVASKDYKFEIKKFLSISLLIVLINFLLIIFSPSYSLSHKYEGIPSILFYIEIPILVLMTIKRYRYTHYFFIFLIIQEMFICSGPSRNGDYFLLNFGFMTYFPTLVYYAIYVLSLQWLNIKNSLAVYFASSLSMIVLGLMILDRYSFHYYLGEGLLIIGVIFYIYSIFLLFKDKKESWKVEIDV